MKQRSPGFHPSICLALGLGAVSSSSAVVLFDFNTGDPSPTQSGWTSAPLGIGSNGTVSIATGALGPVSVDSRDRTNANTDGPSGDVANTDMWRDFLFANENNGTGGNGLVLTISGLGANTEYPITIWGYDALSSSFPPRVADWSGGGGSGTLSFDPTATDDPTSLSDHSFVTFIATADGSGELVLTGAARAQASGGSSSHDVFINGLEIGDAIPEPSTCFFALLSVSLLGRRKRS